MTTLVDMWILWLVLWLIIGAIYAGLVRWMLAHRRHGPYWQRNRWLFAAVGNVLVACAVWSLCGDWQGFALVMLANVALGVWQIAGALAWNAVHEALVEEKREEILGRQARS